MRRVPPTRHRRSEAWPGREDPRTVGYLSPPPSAGRTGRRRKEWRQRLRRGRGPPTRTTPTPGNRLQEGRPSQRRLGPSRKRKGPRWTGRRRRERRRGPAEARQRLRKELAEAPWQLAEPATWGELRMSSPRHCRHRTCVRGVLGSCQLIGGGDYGYIHLPREQEMQLCMRMYVLYYYANVR